MRRLTEWHETIKEKTHTLPYAARAAVNALVKGVHVPLAVRTPRGLRAAQETGWAYGVDVRNRLIMIDVQWEGGPRKWEQADHIAASIVAGA